MSLSFRQLEVVRAVNRHGSVTGAAGALGISQPAVSMMLRECRRAAGFPLFVRKQGRFQPTAETVALVSHLDRVFNGIDRINRLVVDMRDGKVGTIQIAATPTLADNLLPRAVTSFQQLRPEVQISIHTMDNINVIDHVIHDRVDFGVVLSPPEHLDAQSIDICTAELICVAHPDHPLAKCGTITPDMLAPHPLISFSRGLPLGRLVEQYFRDAGLARRVAIEVNQSSVACALARSGAGIAILDPFWFLDERDHGLIRLHLKPQTRIVGQILVSRNATLSRPARLLLTTIRNTATILKRSGAF